MAADHPSGSPIPRAGPWQRATVRKITIETYRVKTFTLELDQWRPFFAGQHYDVRLTAPDGYQAQRSYSIASSPETAGSIDLTIELVPDGEVSPYFYEVVEPGDRLEVRGPIGGPFTWTSTTGGPLLLLAGGSGVVPIMSILRHRSNVAPDTPTWLLYSSRSPEDIIYRDELGRRTTAEDCLTVLHTLTRVQPPGWRGYSRRIDRPMLEEVLDDIGVPPHTYVCGPTPLVESVADNLVPGIRSQRYTNMCLENPVYSFGCTTAVFRH